MTKQRSYQLLSFVEIKNSLGESQPGLTPPVSEKQIRPLTKLQPEQQVAAWKDAVEIAGGERPTSPRAKLCSRQLSKTKFRGEAKHPDKEQKSKANTYRQR